MKTNFLSESSSAKEIKKLDLWDREHVDTANPSTLLEKIMKSTAQSPSNFKFLKFAQNSLKSKLSLNMDHAAEKNIKKSPGILIERRNNSQQHFTTLTFDIPKKKDDINFAIEDRFAREQSKIENVHTNELMKISHQIIIKKLEKRQYQEILNELYLELNNASNEEKLQVDMLKVQSKGIETKFNKFVSSHSKIHSEIPFVQRSRRMSSVPTFQSLQAFSKRRVSSNASFADQKIQQIIKAQSRTNQLDHCIKDYKKTYKKIKAEFETIIKDCKEQLNNIASTEQYLKLVFQTISKEHKNYYTKILKRGLDTRKDGLIWACKKLIELGCPLEYNMFPNYLDNEEIDFIILIANLQVESFQLCAMLKTLIKRREKMKNEETADKLEKMGKYLNHEMDYKNFVRNNFSEEIFSKESIRRFEEIYLKYEKLMKVSLERKFENLNMEKIISEVRKKVLRSQTEKKENDLMGIFEVNPMQKEYLNDLIKIRARLKEIEKTVEKEYQKAFEKFKLKHTSKTLQIADKNYLKIYRCLFGRKILL